MKNIIIEKENTQKEANSFLKSILSQADASLDGLLADRKNTIYLMARLAERIEGYTKTISDNQREIESLQRQIDSAIGEAKDPQQFVALIRDLEGTTADCRQWISKTREKITEHEKLVTQITRNIFNILRDAIKATRPAVLESLNSKIIEIQETMLAWSAACQYANIEVVSISGHPEIPFPSTLSNIYFQPNNAGGMRCL